MDKRWLAIIIPFVTFFIIFYSPFIPHERPLTYEVSDVSHECLIGHEFYSPYSQSEIEESPSMIPGFSGGYWIEHRWVTISMVVKNTDSVAGKFFIQLNSDDGILYSEYLYLNPNEAKELHYHEETFTNFASYDVIPDKSTIHLSLNEILFDKTNDFPESDHYNAPNATYK